MKALLCREYCDWDTLEVAEVPSSPIRADGVRIDIEAASVSFAMSLQVAGQYQVKYPLPFTPGTEVGGIVTELGPQATRRSVPGNRPLRVGDRVLALLDWGGIAEEVVARAPTVYRLPDESSDVTTIAKSEPVAVASDAAAPAPAGSLPVVPAIHLPNAYGTAYGILVWRCALDRWQTGDERWSERARPPTVLVTGAAGAVGCAAVQIARTLGARVIGVAGSPDKQAFVRAQGAEAIGYERLREAVLELTEGRGADLVLDQVGGDTFAQAVRCTATFGQIVTVGYAGGTIPSVSVNLLLVKNIAVIGHNMGLYFGWGPVDRRLEFEPKMRAMMDQLFAWTLAGELRPTVSHEFALTEYREAMRTVRSRQSTGKVVIRPRLAPKPVPV